MDNATFGSRLSVEGSTQSHFICNCTHKWFVIAKRQPDAIILSIGNKPDIITALSRYTVIPEMKKIRQNSTHDLNEARFRFNSTIVIIKTKNVEKKGIILEYS
jgi:hypothetical protein